MREYSGSSNDAHITPTHKTMRIAINCRSLEYASGGVKEYLVNLVNTLLSIDKKNTYVLFHSRVSFIGSFPGAEEVSLYCSNRLLFDWLKLPMALKQHGIDLAFFPSSNMPRGIPCKAVTAMMDLGYYYNAYRMYPLADTIYMKWAMRYTARRSEHFLAISEHTRADMTRILGIPEEKITLTHLAADAFYRQSVAEDEVLRFRRHHGLMRPFFLYTGNLSPRKNLRALLEAFAAVKDRVDTDLVVTGGISRDDARGACGFSPGIADRVHRLGYVERRDMPVLYKAALAFVFPSLFEGFGLPVLEAQAMGVPVICADNTSLPEVAGDSTYMIDAADIPALSTALTDVATDPALRERLIALGHANEVRFSWRTTAEKTLEIFERVASG